MIASQVVKHVIHIDRLVYRPWCAVLVVGEVGVGKVYFHVGSLPAVAPRQAQRVPEVGAEQLVDGVFRNLKLSPARQEVGPKPERAITRGGVVQRQEGLPIRGGSERRREFDNELLRATRCQRSSENNPVCLPTGSGADV